jgi:hypothetical protein
MTVGIVAILDPVPKILTKRNISVMASTTKSNL